MFSKTWIALCGIAFCLGMATQWIISKNPELTEGKVTITAIDTVFVMTTDTITTTDTIQSKPRIKYVPRRIHDTVFVAEKVREYATEKTFSDSAWVKHKFDIRDIDNILVRNFWDYRAPPKQIITQTKEIKVFPTKTEKIIKSVAWITAGAGITAMINNNK